MTTLNYALSVFNDAMNSTLVWTPDKPYYEPLTWSDPSAYWVGLALIAASIIGMWLVVRKD